MTDSDAMPPARPAATVVIVRDGDAGLEVLLLERSKVGAFPGMWVFPGGRIDDADPGDDELARARSAAVREAAEEVGLVVEVTELVTWAHWTPPPVQPKRFNTWFFVAPWTGATVTIDEHEIVAHAWHRPAHALASGLPIAPPTFVTLHQLTAYRSVSEVQRIGPPNGVERFATKHAPVTGGAVLLWHGDAGYDVGDAEIQGPRHRATLSGTGISGYERS